METAPTPVDEPQRLQALQDLAILDTPPEERFDRITRLASRVLDMPIALVSLVDEDRQWFKASTGLDVDETPRDISFCGHAVAENDVLVVRDAHDDARFADNPLVTDAPSIRFYAGCPLRAPNGQPVGTLCVLDYEPREIDDSHLAALADLGAIVEEELATRKLANADSLTGLANRRGFRTLAGHALALADRQSIPVSLLFLDLNKFKNINDEFGHAVGDETLKTVAEILIEVFRSSDVVARIGGDEFCVLMTGMTEDTANEPLERLAARVADHNERPEALFEIAYSTGLVSFERASASLIDDIMAEADRRMYAAKRDHGESSARRELADVLVQLTGSLSTADSYETRMNRLCQETVRLLGCDRSSILRLDGEHYRAAFNDGNPPEIAAGFDEFRVRRDDRLIAAAVDSRAAVVVNDAADSPLMNAELARRGGIRSIMVAPLIGGDEPLGVMTAEYNEHAGEFTELDSTLLHAVAQLAAAALSAEAHRP